MKNFKKIFLLAIIILTSASACAPAHAQVKFDNPLQWSTIDQVVQSLLDHLQGIIGVIAVTFVVIGGIMYMLSSGNEDMIKRAKNTWTAAVIGFAIALAGPTFLREIKDVLGAGSIPSPNGLSLQEIVLNILNKLLSILGIIAIISLVIGGMMYMTAFGDEKKMETGKKMVTYSIIGIVISLSAVIIIRQIQSILTGGAMM